MNSFALVVMGATGDLAKKKLFPAIQRLIARRKENLPFYIVAVGRKEFSSEEFRKIIEPTLIKQFPEAGESLLKNLHYFQMEFHETEKYSKLKEYMLALEHQFCEENPVCSFFDKLYYLATLPEHFSTISKNLNQAGMNKEGIFKVRVVFEKPFGHSEKEAKELNREILKYFGEEQIFRIDHYLGKELLKSLFITRFSNILFSEIWNGKNIDHVQLNLVENFGVEGRGNFYDTEGALRDVMQNHMLQMLCMTAMAAPKTVDEFHIRSEKVKILKAIQQVKKENIVLGQYEGYEKDVGKKSGTETFAALKVFLDIKEWKEVPFYLRTGKCLKEKFSSIYIQFKMPENIPQNGSSYVPNYLVIQVQPEPGIVIQLNGKMPGEKNSAVPIKMTYCHDCFFGANTPEAYEALIEDALAGDQSAFIREDEIEASWKIVDRILWQKVIPIQYQAGSFGPKEADLLIEKDGRKWFNKIENVVQGTA